MFSDDRWQNSSDSAPEEIKDSIWNLRVNLLNSTYDRRPQGIRQHVLPNSIGISCKTACSLVHIDGCVYQIQCDVLVMTHYTKSHTRGNGYLKDYCRTRSDGRVPEPVESKTGFQPRRWWRILTQVVEQSGVSLTLRVVRPPRFVTCVSCARCAKMKIII